MESAFARLDNHECGCGNKLEGNVVAALVRDCKRKVLFLAMKTMQSLTAEPVEVKALEWATDIAEE